MLNPCCCITPRIGTFIFGVIDLISSVSLIAWVVGDILNSNTRTDNCVLLNESVIILLNIWGELALGAVLLFMALLLLIGAYRNAADKIRLWLLLWTIYVVLTIVFIVLNVYQGARVGPRGGSSMGVVLIFIYQIWVVWAYLHELRYGPAGLTYCPAQVI